MNRIFRALTVVTMVNLSASGVFAEAVDFSATLSNSCTLSLTAAGVMALSTDGVTLGSEESGGGSAIVSVLSLGANTLTIGAPSLLTSPFAYDETGQSVEVKYSGEGGLAGWIRPTQMWRPARVSAQFHSLT